ncbi:hypothetical protein FJ661_04395 [Pseudarthrobacter phenanthrenivorans]|uniref:hypothetical protein n=1 Tax=Pseudarthrobacter phenanthrenivorans TaxID=361575 RepID=UPI001128892F|nr:hypothetical protein [Pseudarthrobacter phenanthrenivorans]TPV52545.1 hypothetical protein FJ661_04395 [Pseudarthrobacter phenanthrenivorans]
MESPATEGEPATSGGKKRFSLSHLLESSGFWGATGALLGAFVGGIFTFMAAAMSTSAEAERSRHAFFLAERVAVYSGLLGDAQAFQLSATRYNNLVRLNTEDTPEAKAVLEEAKADYDDAVAACWQVEVIATEAVQEAKQSIARELDKAWNYLDDETAEAAEYFQTVDKAMTGHTTQFAQAAGQELEAGR